MSTHFTCFRDMLSAGVTKCTVSRPASRQEPYKKITAQQQGRQWQIAKYTEKQVFHENLSAEDCPARLEELTRGHYLQVNGWSADGEHILLISRKGACNYQVRKNQLVPSLPPAEAHNRKKHYLLEEGQIVAPLVDMGIFTQEGKVVHAMYGKFRQINRFLEILDDEISRLKSERIHVIDFGCGKSYLTFIVYDYLTRIRGMQANIIGLDLKADVITKCNNAAQKYGYDGLRFELGDINGYRAPFDVDVVMTLHACDTATDYALYNAVRWNARLIFSVPCCQHELNGQISTPDFPILTRYGIIKERFSALATDAIRANLLEYSGYKTQLLEFIDLEDTPKNLLIRAVRRPITPKALRQKALQEVRALTAQFGFRPTLCRLLAPENTEPEEEQTNRES